MTLLNEIKHDNVAQPKYSDIIYLPWETQRLTIKSFFLSFYFLLAEPKKAIACINPGPAYRAYSFSLAVYIADVMIKLFLSNAGKYPHSFLTGINSFWEVAAVGIVIFVVALLVEIKDTVIFLLAMYLISKVKANTSIAFKICCYFSFFDLLFWVQYIGEYYILIKGIFIGVHICYKHNIDLNRTLLIALLGSIASYLTMEITATVIASYRL